MLPDGEFARYDFDDLTLGVRSSIAVGVSTPAEVLLPVMVTSRAGPFRLERATVYAAGDTVREHPLGWLEETAESQSVPDTLLSARVRSLGDDGVFTHVRVDLSGLVVSRQNEILVETDVGVTSRDRTERALRAPTRIEISPLPSPTGWHPGDAHIHTKWSDGWLNLEHTVRHVHDVSGLSWMVLTDHSPKIQPRWDDYVTACASAQDFHHALVCPGAEFATGGSIPNGHALGYGMSSDKGLPTPAGLPQAVLSSIKAQGPKAFAAIAHPYHWRYDWPDWNVTGFHAMELATGGARRMSEKTRRRWFELLAKSLDTWRQDGALAFVAGLASTDSHSIPLFVAPGERHMTWVRTGDDMPPTDCASLFSHIQAGHCVASCGGDFGVLFINGAGPGCECASATGAALRCEFEFQPRDGHFLRKLTLHDPDGPINSWTPTGKSPFSHSLAAADENSFYIAEFLFSDHTGMVWEVWTNPVWVRSV